MRRSSLGGLRGLILNNTKKKREMQIVCIYSDVPTLVFLPVAFKYRKASKQSFTLTSSGTLIFQVNSLPLGTVSRVL